MLDFAWPPRTRASGLWAQGVSAYMWQFQVPRLLAATSPSAGSAHCALTAATTSSAHYLISSMASSPAATLKEDETLNTPTQDAAVNNLIEGVARVSVQDGDSGDTSTSKSERVSSQLLRVYTRSQVLYLRDSPLVKPPEGMPSMKEWFGYVCQCRERTLIT